MGLRESGVLLIFSSVNDDRRESRSISAASDRRLLETNKDISLGKGHKCCSDRRPFSSRRSSHNPIKLCTECTSKKRMRLRSSMSSFKQVKCSTPSSFEMELLPGLLHVVGGRAGDSSGCGFVCRWHGSSGGVVAVNKQTNVGYILRQLPGQFSKLNMGSHAVGVADALRLCV